MSAMGTKHKTISIRYKHDELTNLTNSLYVENRVNFRYKYDNVSIRYKHDEYTLQ